MIITIDGPASAGKTSISKNLALKLNEKYPNLNFERLDTGAMFRMVNIFLTEHFKYIDLLPEEIYKEENFEKLEELKRVLEKVNMEILDVENIGDENEGKKYLLNGKDVTTDIRKKEKMKYVSAVSATVEVRKIIVKKQKEVAKGKNIVVEGRDIGSVVFKDAEVKFFLTASLKERARRRLLQLNEDLKRKYKEYEITEEEIYSMNEYKEIYEALEMRDKKDTERKVAPLIVPEGSIIIDNSNMTKQETLEKMLEKINNKIKEKID